LATQPSPLPDASSTTRGAVSTGPQTLGTGEKSADQIATPIVRVKHSIPAGTAGTNEAQLSASFGVLMASEDAAFDPNFYPVRSYFPAVIGVTDTTVELDTQGGVVSFLPLSTVALTGNLILSGGAMGPVTFSTPGSNGIVTIAIMQETPGSGFTVTMLSGPLCILHGGGTAILKLYDSITLAYCVGVGMWVEVSRNIV